MDEGGRFIQTALKRHKRANRLSATCSPVRFVLRSGGSERFHRSSRAPVGSPFTARQDQPGSLLWLIFGTFADGVKSESRCEVKYGSQPRRSKFAFGAPRPVAKPASDQGAVGRPRWVNPRNVAENRRHAAHAVLDAPGFAVLALRRPCRDRGASNGASQGPGLKQQAPRASHSVELGAC